MNHLWIPRCFGNIYRDLLPSERVTHNKSTHGHIFGARCQSLFAGFVWKEILVSDFSHVWPFYWKGLMNLSCGSKVQRHCISTSIHHHHISRNSESRSSSSGHRRSPRLNVWTSWSSILLIYNKQSLAGGNNNLPRKVFLSYPDVTAAIGRDARSSVTSERCILTLIPSALRFLRLRCYWMEHGAFKMQGGDYLKDLCMTAEIHSITNSNHMWSIYLYSWLHWPQSQATKRNWPPRGVKTNIFCV